MVKHIDVAAQLTLVELGVRVKPASHAVGNIIDIGCRSSLAIIQVSSVN